jgi:cobalt-zinc-cadmium efflux system protein
MGLHHHHHRHEHEHGHHHGHRHGRTANKRALLLSFVLIAAFLIVEVIGGFLTNSLALLSDAGHMVSDASALLLSLVALNVAARPPSLTKTFGFHRFEILAALTNGVTLGIISLAILWEAYDRLLHPPAVASETMLGIAVLGLMVNVAAAFILLRGDYRENVNIRSALLHVLGDLLGSVGAIIGGVLMWQLGWYIADPIISVIVAVLILISSWRVMKESVNVLMEGTPAQIDSGQVREELRKLPGVIDVHDLHIWSVTSGFESLTCHLIVADDVSSFPVLNQALVLLQKQFGITHATIQIENSSVHHAELECQSGSRPHHHPDGHTCS